MPTKKFDGIFDGILKNLKNKTKLFKIFMA